MITFLIVMAWIAGYSMAGGATFWVCEIIETTSEAATAAAIFWPVALPAILGYLMIKRIAKKANKMKFKIPKLNWKRKRNEV